MATVAASEPSVCASYAPGPTDGSVVVRSEGNRELLPRIAAPEFLEDGSTEDMFGSYEPAPGVRSLRTLMRCADDERKELLGIAALPVICFSAPYDPGPGVSSPMISSFISRADEAPNAPEPVLLDRPKDFVE